MIAPLATPDEFFGIVTANFDSAPGISVRADLELQTRMIGLADHAVTAMQNTRLLEQVTHLAWHDSLTGLPNRRLLEDRVSQELVRARRNGESTCMFFIDLDRLKQVNDTFGHAAGDELIRQRRRTSRRHRQAPRHRRAARAETSSPSCCRASPISATSTRSPAGPSRR